MASPLRQCHLFHLRGVGKGWVIFNFLPQPCGWGFKGWPVITTPISKLPSEPKRTPHFFFKISVLHWLPWWEGRRCWAMERSVTGFAVRAHHCRQANSAGSWNLGIQAPNSVTETSYRIHCFLQQAEHSWGLGPGVSGKKSRGDGCWSSRSSEPQTGFPWNLLSSPAWYRADTR